MVIRHYGGSSPGFVLAGRSLRETEQRIARLITIVMPIWIGALVVLLIYFGIISRFGARPT
jgi:hypothetical protein